MHDPMLLDQLIELALRDAEPRPRNLAIVAKQYAGLEISKDDPFRMRYAEIIGVDWAEVEEGFFAYAIKDAIVTLRAFRPMLLEAQRLMIGLEGDGSGIADDVLARYGGPRSSSRSRVPVAWPGSSDTGCTWTWTGSGPPRRC